MGRQKTDPKELLRSLNNDIMRTTKGTPNIQFTSIIGQGAFGTVATVSVAKGAKFPPPSDCSHLSVLDLHPAVKISEGTEKYIQRAEREYQLAKWAASRGLGPKVYCSAIWETDQGPPRHLLFMEHLWGTLDDLAEENPPNREAQSHAWLLAFLQTQNVSKDQILGADLKPGNLLVRYAHNTVSGVYITDWDDKFWFKSHTPEDALLYNFFALAVNSMSLIRTKYELEHQWVPDICQFCTHLMFQWYKTPQFKDFLIDHDVVNYLGPYHYIEYYAVQVIGPMPKKSTPQERAERFLQAFDHALVKRWGSKMKQMEPKGRPAALAATRIGDKRFLQSRSIHIHPGGAAHTPARNNGQ